MKVLVEIAKYGVLAHFVYMVLITYWFIENIQSGRVKEFISDYKLFTTDVAGVAGNFATAF